MLFELAVQQEIPERTQDTARRRNQQFIFQQQASEDLPEKDAGEYRYATADDLLSRQAGPLFSAIQFRIFAFVLAGVNPGINGKTAGPALDHEIHRHKSLQQRNRQLHAGEPAFLTGADRQLIAPKASRKSAI